MTLRAGIVKQALAFLHFFKTEEGSITRLICLYRAHIGAQFNGSYTPNRNLKGKEYSCHSKQDESLHS
jgi:hypothetical protein